MALSQITWKEAQQFPDDGNRYEAIEGEVGLPCLTPAAGPAAFAEYPDGAPP